MKKCSCFKGTIATLRNIDCPIHDTPYVDLQVSESQKMFKLRSIEEFYSKEGDTVYWNWRFANEKEWRKEETAYPEIPIVTFPFSSKINQ